MGDLSLVCLICNDISNSQTHLVVHCLTKKHQDKLKSLLELNIQKIMKS